MKSVFESMGGTYTKSGDYYIPDLTVPEGSNRKSSAEEIILQELVYEEDRT